MVKVKLFMTKENLDVDAQINDFLEKEDVEVIDIKSNTFLDTNDDVIITSALLIYKKTNKVTRDDFLKTMREFEKVRKYDGTMI